MRRAIKIMLGILGGLVLLILIAFGLMQTGFGKRQILAAVEAQLADPPARLEAKSLEGIVPFAMTLTGVRLSDAQGVWLEADRVALDWAPTALLRQTFKIESLTADRIALLRAPLTPPSPPRTEPTTLELPRLPVAVDLRRLVVDRLELGPEFLGEPAVFAIGAAARLGDPAQGLQASLTLNRTDRDLDRASLTLDYRPEADTLIVDARAAEPKGGLITKLLGFSGHPDFALTLAGSGPLADWQAKGRATLDNKPLLDLAATSIGPARDRAVAFDATLHSLPMLPDDIAPLVEGGVAANGRVHLGDFNRPIRVEALRVTTRAGALDAKGTIDPARSVDLDLDVQAADSTPFASLLPPELSWSGITAQAHVAGAIAQPKATLEAKVADLAYAANKVGAASISAAATLDTEKLRADGLTVALDAKSLALPDPKLQELLADGVTLDVAGAVDASGALTADHLTLHAGDVALAANGSAENWGETAKLDGQIDVGDLAPLLALAGLQGKGSAHLDLSATRGTDGVQAKLDVTTSGAALGLGAVDRLTGPAPKLSLSIRQSAAGALTIEQASLDSAAATATASGTMAADRTLDMKAEAKLKDLGAFLPQAKGGLAITAGISGSADDPAAQLRIAGQRLAFDSVTVQDLQVAVDAAKLVSAPEARVRAKAAVNALAASLDTAVALDPQTNRISARNVDARLGQTSLQGKLDLAGGLIAGDLALASPSLGELGALAGTPLQGSAKGTIALRPEQGKQNATAQVAADSVAVSGVGIARADLKAAASDVLGGDPALDARIEAGGIAAGGRRIDRLNATAHGRLADLALAATASGANVSLAVAANLQRGRDEMRLALAKLDLVYNKVKAGLLHPAEIAFGHGNTTVSGLAIGAEGGTLTLDAALAAESNEISLALKQIPLSLASAASPDVDLTGTIDGTLRLAGPKSAPNATLSMTGKGLGVVGAGAPPSDLTLEGSWQGGRVQAKGRITLAKSGGLDFSAGLPMPADPGSGFPVYNPTADLTAAAKGGIDLALANAFIPGGADHVAGHATVDLAAGGAVGNPVLSGTVALDDGRYENQRYGTRLQKITARLEGRGSKLTLTSLTARTPGGGTLEGSGDIDFGGAQPVAVSLKMDHARLINAPLGTAVTDGALQVEGALSSRIALTGKVKIVKAEIRIPDRLPADVEEIPVREINLPPDRQAAADAANAPPPKSIRIALDLAVDAPEQVFVRGRGLDAEMGGALKIQGTADQPVITGALNLRRGDFNLLSRRLSFNKGTVTFSGGARIDPMLDFAATTKLPAADVTATVTGAASKPVIALTSTPELPQDEILAQLLFGKASGALSPFEAVQLAQAAAELAGVETGPGVLDKVRQALGLDRLDVESGEGASAAPSLSAGRYVSRGVFVGAKQGATPGSSAATVEIELTPNVKVETDVGADSTGKAGINLEWNY